MSNPETDKTYYQPVDEQQPELLDMSDWKREWQDMPEFEQKSVEPYYTVIVRFSCEKDLREFSGLVQQELTKGREAASIWYPKKVGGNVHMDSRRVYADES